MSYVGRVQIAVNFIEGNLRESISLPDVGKAAAFSPYHFHKIFSLTVGEGIKNYIRKRRLTEAAYELRDSDRRILDIALDYQFESQESFSRAFKKLFLINPGGYRDLTKFPKFYEKKKLTEEAIMHHAIGIEVKAGIIKKDSFWVIGMEYKGSKEHRGEIPKLWESFDKRAHEIPNRDGTKISYGVCFATPSMLQKDEMSYLASVPVSNPKNIPEGMVAREVKGGEFVVVTHRGGISKISTTIDFIYGSWLPKSGFDPDDRADLELYDERFKFNSDECEFDILVPIKKSTH